MPSFKEPVPQPVQAVKEPFISERPYESVAVDSKYQPIASILTFVAGSSWTVQYYRQLLTKDSELATQQTSLEAVFQQYQKIAGFEIKVSSALSPSFETETGEHALQGTGNIYPSFKPNRGDMFIADIGDGRAGLFEIYGVEQKNVTRDSTYEINYRIVDYVNENNHKDLEKKVVVNSYFVKDFIQQQQNPIVVEETYHLIQILKKSYSDLQQLWFQQNYNAETKSFPIPGQSKATYDPFLMGVLEYFLPQEVRPASRRVTKYVVESDDLFNVPTLWSSLIRGDDDFSFTQTKEMCCIPIPYVTYVSEFNSIRFSRFEKLLFPKGGELGNDYLGSGGYTVNEYRLDSPYSSSESAAIDLKYLFYRKVLNGLDDIKPSDLYIPLIHPVGIDDYYILSEYFYNKAQYGQSRLELQTRAYLEHKALDCGALVELCADVCNWGKMERFYYIPVLLFLIGAALRGF